MPKLLMHPYALLAMTALMWGGNAVAGKLAIGHISPMLLTFLRWTIAVAILAPLAWPRLRADWPLIRANLVFLTVLGASGFAFFNALFYLALYYTSAIHATIVQSAMPALVFIGMFVFFRATVTWLQIVGFSLTFAGVILTAAGGDPTMLLGLHLNRGDALILLAVLLYGGYTVALMRKPAIHWTSLIFTLSCASLAASAPLALWEWRSDNSLAPDLQGWAVALFTALFASILSQVFYIKGVELIGANRANLFINLVPIFGAILAVLILGEPLFGYHVAALALVLGGIMLAERGKRQDAAAIAATPADGRP